MSANEIAQDIVQATEEGRIDWRKTDAEDTYITASAAGSMTFRAPVPGGRQTAYIEVRNYHGEIIYNLYDGNLNLIAKMIQDRTTAPSDQARQIIESML